MFSGSLVAVVTPMLQSGALDHVALLRLVDLHIASKTDGIIIAGTTGESSTLTSAEQLEILTLVIKHAQNRIKNNCRHRHVCNRHDY